MRPVRLSIEGLACFTEKQEIDFSGLELFAISGPTGAGKSTLLDAILFALYGTVPRVGKQDLKEMISSAREPGSVMLEFKVGDQRYQIARSLRRKGAATVRLDRHDGQGFNENVADQVHTVNDAIANVLGLKADAFTQAVILPQGDFARFLKADPRERRDMLRSLLRLEVYERMREVAQSVSGARKVARDSTERLLADEYEDVTEHALIAMNAESVEVGKKLNEKREKRDMAQAGLVLLRRLHDNTRELVAKEARLTSLTLEGTAIVSAKAELK